MIVRKSDGKAEQKACLKAALDTEMIEPDIAACLVIGMLLRLEICL